jgi:hypothetical protein
MQSRDGRPHARRRASIAAVLAAFIVLASLTWAQPGNAASAPGTSRAQADYATDSFGDPWDFSNPEDFNLTPGVQSEGVHNLAMANGQLSGTADAGGKFEFLRSYKGMALPWGRDPAIFPVDAGHYTQISFSMTADHDSAGGVLWFTCAQMIPSCQGGFPFPTQAGSHVYAFDIPSQTPFAGSLPWSGSILGLFVVPSGPSSISVSFDWVRLTPPGADATPAPAPQPRFLTPSRAGGSDYASVVRGDAWDFNEPTDVVETSNLDYTVANGVLDGTNTSGDSQIVLPMGATPIDGSRFHRLVFRITYDGGFDLSGNPGGGMVARIIWQIAGHPEFYQDSQDIVVYPGTHLYDVDLATSPASDAADEADVPRVGWVGQQISYIRFDPDEDPGRRHFTLDFVRLASDDDSSTPIRFLDAAWTAGETVDLYATADRSNCSGVVIATALPVTQDVNQVAWPATVPPGRYYVCGRFHGATYESSMFSTAPAIVHDGYASACAGATNVFPDAGLAADCLQLYGIALGKNDGTFGENDQLVRSQVSSFLSRLIAASGVALPQRRVFADVAGLSNTQVQDEIEQLAGSGIIAGFPDGEFHPSDNLSVAQAATLIVRALAYIHAARPAAPALAVQPDTSTNHTYALDQGILDPEAANVAKLVYADQPGDVTARGLLADMLAQSLQQLVGAGVIAPR